MSVQLSSFLKKKIQKVVVLCISSRVCVFRSVVETFLTHAQCGSQPLCQPWQSRNALSHFRIYFLNKNCWDLTRVAQQSAKIV